MGKMGAYQPTQQYKNYTLPTSKPLSSHAFYHEKVRTLQEQIHKKLKKVAELLASLYPKLTDNIPTNIKIVIDKNLEILSEDLDLMQNGLQKKPQSFNTSKLKTNQQRIAEMKEVCNTLQIVRTYEYESKTLDKVKHALHELEHLIQPSSFEVSVKKVLEKSKRKAASANKKLTLDKAKKKIKEKSTVKPKRQKDISKKAKPKKQKDISKKAKPKKTKLSKAKKTKTTVKK